jgi:hypothetical protein
MHHSPHLCQQVPSPVFGFSSENNNLGLGSLVLGDISGGLYRTDDLPCGTADRRDDQRNINQPSVFASTNGLKIIHPVTAPHTLENCILFI